MEAKVSVIVPIYRVENYLSQCIESLRCQKLKDIEIILVDDGSPDSCGDIAEQYANLDKRIKVIHQPNSGLGPARNTGIGAAEGKYIGFVDSDDWVRPEMFLHLYEEAMKTDADIVVSGHCDMAEGEVIVTKPHPLRGLTLTVSEEIHRVRKNLYGHAPWEREVEAFPMSVCMSLYRTDMILKNGLEFQNVFSEDTIFNLGAYSCAKVIHFSSYTEYCYRKENQASLTGSFSMAKIEQFQRFLSVLRLMAEAEGDTECILRAKRMAIDYCRLFVGLVANSRLAYGEKKEAIRRFTENEAIRICWEGYPVKTLPLRQRIFHTAILLHQYDTVLMLNWLRRKH